METIDNNYRKNLKKYLDANTFEKFVESSKEEFLRAIEQEFGHEFIKNLELQKTFSLRISKIRAINTFFEINLWRFKCLNLLWFSAITVSQLETFMHSYNKCNSCEEIKGLCEQNVFEFNNDLFYDFYNRYMTDNKTLKKILEYIKENITIEKFNDKQLFLEETLLNIIEDDAFTRNFWPMDWICGKKFKALEYWSPFKNRNEERRECFSNEMKRTNIILQSANLTDNKNNKLFCRF